MDNVLRTPAGQPTGGQFAPLPRSEALIELATAIGPPTCRICGTEAEEVEDSDDRCDDCSDRATKNYIER